MMQLLGDIELTEITGKEIDTAGCKDLIFSGIKHALTLFRMEIDSFTTPNKTTAATAATLLKAVVSSDKIGFKELLSLER